MSSLQRLVMGVALTSSLFSWNIAQALPQNGTVVSGAAAIDQSHPQKTIINQGTSSAVINWHGFDTTANETIQFNQPNANSTVLNRITSGVPTNFAGSLIANGEVFVVNPAGMVFTGTSQINAASFIATTMDIRNDDFMQGKYHFFFKPGGYASIVNNGTITVADAGLVALIAPNVVNSQSGIITANLGTVELASGKAYVLDFNQDKLINFDADAILKSGSVDNAGKIRAKDGRVFLTASAVGKVLDNIVSMTNIAEADSITEKNGDVVLNGSVNNTGNILASYINFYADKDITIMGEINSDALFHGGVTAVSLEGNITIGGRIWSLPGYAFTASKGEVIKLDTARLHSGLFYPIDIVGNQPIVVYPMYMGGEV